MALPDERVAGGCYLPSFFAPRGGVAELAGLHHAQDLRSEPGCKIDRPNQ